MKKLLLLLFTASTFAVNIASANIVPIVDNQVVEWGTTIQSDSLINFYADGVYDVCIYIGNAEEFQALYGINYQDYQTQGEIGLIYKGSGDAYLWGTQGVDFILGSTEYGQHNMYAVYNNGQFVGEIFEVPEPATSLLILGALPLLRRKNRK